MFPGGSVLDFGWQKGILSSGLMAYRVIKIKKALFPVAGFGTRFLPATKVIPKEMLPLVDKPLIHYGVEEALSSGIEEIVMVTGRGKTAIEDYFDFSPELESFLEEKGKEEPLKEVKGISNLADIIYVRQKRPLGLGHAVLCAERVIGKEAFAVLLGDDVVDAETPVIAQMVEVFGRYPNTILAVEEVPSEEVYRYGVIKGEKVGEGLYRVTEIVEKPSPEEAPSNLAVIGRYILSPQIFDALKRTEPGAGGEIQLTDAISILLKEEPVYAYKFKGRRYDGGDKVGLIKATIAFAMKRKDMKKEVWGFLEDLFQQSGSQSDA